MKKIINFFLLLSFLLINLKCEIYICNEKDSKDLKIGDKAYLCIHIVESKTRIVFPLEVDEYSVVTINGIYSQISPNSSDISFLAQVGEKTSIFPSVSNFYIYK